MDRQWYKQGFDPPDPCRAQNEDGVRQMRFTAHFGITQNQALEIALKHAGLSKAEVSYANVTQDFDNGMQRKIVLYIIFEKKITYYLVSWHNILCVLLEKQGESRQ